MKRKELMKKAIALLTAVTMAASVAGCGKQTETATTNEGETKTEDSGATENADTAQTTEQAEAPAGEAELFGEEVTIRVMAWDRGNAAPGTTTEDNALTKWIQQQVKEKFNINVEYVSVPRSESDNKLNIMMSGGTAPDIVFTYDQTMFYNYANSGALHELSDSYGKFGSDIAKYCEEAQPIGIIEDQRFAVMKQRGTESARHLSYIRKDWLDELGMSVPTTKEELGKYLYAVKEKQLGGANTSPWAMSGRTDTEKMYLNFIGSYVNLPTEKDAYVYNESYMAVAPGSRDGLKVLNTWYNDGLITKDFPTDTTEDAYKANVANGSVGFLLDDVTNTHASFEVLNNNLGKETFVTVQCFDLPDGSYRLPFEYRHAMFVMIPSSTDAAKIDACMKYLNWMSDPEVAVNIRYTPDHTVDANGVAIEPTEAVKNEKGYPGTCDDYGIMNLNYDWVNDVDVMSQVDFENQATPWASLEWYKSYYTERVKSPYKFRFPVYSYISEDEQTFGADIKTRMVEFVYKVICAPADQFDLVYDAGYKELENAGLKKILDGRAAFFDTL